MKLDRKKLNELKQNIEGKKEKANDMDVLIAQFMKLPFGQFKKLLSDNVLAILEEYGYTEG